MKRLRTALKLGAVLALPGLILTGCASTESEEGSSQISGGVYYGAGFYDPWYYGTYYPPDVIVTPPPGSVAPPRVEHPIARPPASPRPTPMPSIPMAPRPALRR